MEHRPVLRVRSNFACTAGPTCLYSLAATSLIDHVTSHQAQAAFMTEAEQVLVIAQVCRGFIAVRRTVFPGKSMQPAVNHSHLHGETQRGLVIDGH